MKKYLSVGILVAGIFLIFIPQSTGQQKESVSEPAEIASKIAGNTVLGVISFCGAAFSVAGLVTITFKVTSGFKNLEFVLSNQIIKSNQTLEDKISKHEKENAQVVFELKTELLHLTNKYNMVMLTTDTLSERNEKEQLILKQDIYNLLSKIDGRLIDVEKAMQRKHGYQVRGGEPNIDLEGLR